VAFRSADVQAAVAAEAGGAAEPVELAVGPAAPDEVAADEVAPDELAVAGGAAAVLELDEAQPAAASAPAASSGMVSQAFFTTSPRVN
jgi:hypothetical protein